MFSRQKLEAAMTLFGDRQEDLASGIGIARPSLSKKMCGKSDFRAREIEYIKCRYNLTPDAVDAIFFATEIK